jgi:hypothetical protein
LIAKYHHADYFQAQIISTSVSVPARVRNLRGSAVYQASVTASFSTP